MSSGKGKAPDRSESIAFARLQDSPARTNRAPDGQSWRRKLFDEALRPLREELGDERAEAPSADSD